MQQGGYGSHKVVIFLNWVDKGHKMGLEDLSNRGLEGSANG